jgi:lipopolysaccharide export LptBFGC system permease protein LptF
VGKIQTKAQGWGYNFITLGGLFGMILLGLFSGIEEGKQFMNLFWYIYTPIQSSMFALLAFYVASAAYRAFRARTLVATILLLTAVVIMLRLIPLGPVSGLNQTVASWILTVPNMAAKRAIAMGIGLGGIATALKVVLGIERSYMGKE